VCASDWRLDILLKAHIMVGKCGRLDVSRFFWVMVSEDGKVETALDLAKAKVQMEA
jgi:hypothetical protein